MGSADALSATNSASGSSLSSRIEWVLACTNIWLLPLTLCWSQHTPVLALRPSTILPAVEREVTSHREAILLIQPPTTYSRVEIHGQVQAVSFV